MGMLVFMASLVQRGRLHLRPVQWWAATTWCQRTGSWTDQITVPQSVLSEVAWWASPAVLQGLPLATKETEVTLFMDASNSGWGAQLGSCSTQGQWSVSQRSWHINVLEMQAVINAARDFLPLLRSRVVRLMCDNAVTVAYINNEGGTRSYTLTQMTIHLLKWCDHKVITLVPVHLPGVHNIQADSLSRVGQTLNTEWTMAMDIHQQTTHHVCIAVSGPQGRVEACHVGALGQRVGPPVCIPAIQDGPSSSAEDRSVTRRQGDSDRSTQQAASWFPELMDLGQEDPIPLFVEGQDLLTQDILIGDGVTETHHYRPSNLHTWKLYGQSWGPRAIPGKLLTWCQGPFVTHHSRCMNPIGQDSCPSVGWKDGTCFESEVIISASIWSICSKTDFSQQR